MFHEHTWIGKRPPAISAGSWPPEAITIQWPWATTLWPYQPHALHSWIGRRPLQAFTDEPHSITIQWPWITTTWLWPPAPSSPPPVANPPPPPPPLPASAASAAAVDLIAITDQKFADSYRTVALNKKHRLQMWLLQQHQQRERDRLDLLEYAFDLWNKTVSQV